MASTASYSSHAIMNKPRPKSSLRRLSLWKDKDASKAQYESPWTPTPSAMDAATPSPLLEQLKRKDLFQQKGYINEEWVSAKSGRMFDVLDPATLQRIATVPEMGVEETKMAVDAAHAAFQEYKKTTARQRARVRRNDSEFAREEWRS